MTVRRFVYIAILLVLVVVLGVLVFVLPKMSEKPLSLTVLTSTPIDLPFKTDIPTQLALKQMGIDPSTTHITLSRYYSGDSRAFPMVNTVQEGTYGYYFEYTETGFSVRFGVDDAIMKSGHAGLILSHVVDAIHLQQHDENLSQGNVYQADINKSHLQYMNLIYNDKKGTYAANFFAL